MLVYLFGSVERKNKQTNQYLAIFNLYQILSNMSLKKYMGLISLEGKVLFNRKNTI